MMPLPFYFRLIYRDWQLTTARIFSTSIFGIWAYNLGLVMFTICGTPIHANEGGAVNACSTDWFPVVLLC